MQRNFTDKQRLLSAPAKMHNPAVAIAFVLGVLVAASGKLTKLPSYGGKNNYWGETYASRTGGFEIGIQESRRPSGI